MNPVNVTVAIAVAAMAYAIWLRRHTLSSRIERPLTRSMVLCAAGIALVSPQSAQLLGPHIHALTGLWHLDTCVGDLLLITSQISAQYALLGSLFTDAERRAWMRFWVQPAITVAMPHMTACMVLTRALHDGTPNILDATPDGWLSAYWVLVCATQTYLWLAGLRVLHIVRRDRRSRPVANAYTAAMASGIGACVIQVIATISGHQPPGHGLITWYLLCSAMAGTCLVAAWSWRRKEQRLRGRKPRPQLPSTQA